jgi:hypothetical protein
MLFGFPRFQQFRGVSDGITCQKIRRPEFLVRVHIRHGKSTKGRNTLHGGFPLIQRCSAA